MPPALVLAESVLEVWVLAPTPSYGVAFRRQVVLKATAVLAAAHKVPFGRLVVVEATGTVAACHWVPSGLPVGLAPTAWPALAP